MRTKVLSEAVGARSWMLVFDKGDEVEPALLQFAAAHNVNSAGLSGIGGFSSVKLGYFDRSDMQYHPNPLNEQVEVMSLLGNIAISGEERKLHAHVVVGRNDGTARGGHLLEAQVWPTLELVLAEFPASLQRKPDDETGLSLIDPEA